MNDKFKGMKAALELQDELERNIKHSPGDLLIELREILSHVRECEIRLAESQQDYIKFITEKIMNNEP